MKRYTFLRCGRSAGPGVIIITGGWIQDTDSMASRSMITDEEEKPVPDDILAGK